MTDKIMFINTQGFQNKKDKLNEIVKTKQPMVLAIAEHFQNNQDLLSCIEGYTVRSSFCRELKNERGGVAIFVRNDVECKPREELDVYCQKKAFEVATVEIPSINLVVSAMYKPPSSSRTKFYSNLDSLLETLKSDTDKKHIIAGDFNIDLSQNKSTNEVMQKNGFKSTLSESTHDYGACYDNFIVDFEPRKARVMRGKFDKISDHHPIELIIGTRSSKAEKDTNSAPPSQTSKESALSSHSESNENTVTSTTNITSKTKEVVPSKQSSPTLSERAVSSSKNSKTNSKNIIPTKPSPISTLESDVSSSNNSKLKMKKITNSKISSSSSQSTSSEFNVSATSNRKPKAEKGIPSTESSATAEKDTNSPPPSQTSKESASSSHSESNENTVTSTTKITSKTKKVVPSKQSSPTLSERAVSSSKNSKTNSKKHHSYKTLSNFNIRI
ncbi:uncharacterized protein LOC124356850 [Homalodisca vitripennis]|uniref:uncharacterized protein LOC124356850 n=1 Tax=Homalodisca vitripennis TaxID=197043 RepID=UPI001EEAF6D3|nr:uncharacterized protein LOC124356850 [Homalodisca vitripennis]